MELKRRPANNSFPTGWTLLFFTGGTAVGLVRAGLLSPWLARQASLLALACSAIIATAWLFRATAARKWGRQSAASLAAGGHSLSGSARLAGDLNVARLGLAAAALALICWGAATGFQDTKRPVIPVLTYHRIAIPPRRRYPVPTTSPREFARQIAWLDSRGYQTVTPSFLTKNSGPWPAKPLVITFDDGWRDNMAAARLMRRHGYVGVIFVVSGEVGHPLQLTTVQLRALDRSGFVIGSHTVSHPHLERLTNDERWREIHNSRQALGRLLGHPVAVFASPYGSLDQSPILTAMLQRAGYRLAFASHNFGLNVTQAQPYTVRRILVPSNPLLARLEFFLLLR